MRDLKVTLVGDAGVGKSSLVTSLVKDNFPLRVQAVVPEILLPLDVTEPGVTTRIVDTSLAQDRRTHLDTSLRSAHVVVLVYAVDNPTTFDRIPTYWLPYMRSLGLSVPVILVGNKIDMRQESGLGSNEALEDELAPVMAEFDEVESCIEASVKHGVNVAEVFYYAQKAVLYPTSPLYSSKTQSLRDACVAALERIFRLCDADKDHLLNDDELNDFQRRCFGTPLLPQELEGIKDLVASTPWHSPAHPHSARLNASGSATRLGERTHAGRPRSSSSSASNSINGDANSSLLATGARHHPHLVEGKLTLAGWLHLHTLFIQRGRLETTWTVLQSYGYGRDLALDPDYLNPPSFQVPSDCAVELSPYGYSFLTDIFEAHDKDQDGSLNMDELRELFSTAPGGRHPWDESEFPERTTTTNENGSVTLQGWLAQWSMTTLLDFKVTLAYLAYLGYPNFALHEASGSGIGSGADPNGHSLNGVSASAKRNKGKRGADHASPPSTTSALKLTQRNTRRLFSSAWSYASSSSNSGSHASTQHASTGSASSTSGAGSSSAKKKKKKKGDPTDRSVFLAYVLGPPGSGKSSLLNAMLGKRFDASYTPTVRPRSVVSAIESHTLSMSGGPALVYGSNGGYERYMVLQEFPCFAAPRGSSDGLTSMSSSNILPSADSHMSGLGSLPISGSSSVLAPPTSAQDDAAFAQMAKACAANADLVIFVYDWSDTKSFSYVTNLRQRFTNVLGSAVGSTLPTLIVGSKGDLEGALQRTVLQPDVYCRKVGLERWSPLIVSALDDEAGGEPGSVEHVYYGREYGAEHAQAVAGGAEGRSAGADDGGIAGRTASMSDLFAIACALAQDPRGNGAVPGAKGRSSGWSWWSPLTWLGLGSSEAPSSATARSSTGAAGPTKSGAAAGVSEGEGLGIRSQHDTKVASRRRSSGNATASAMLWALGIGGGSVVAVVAWQWYRGQRLATHPWTMPWYGSSGSSTDSTASSAGATPNGVHNGLFRWLQSKVEF